MSSFSATNWEVRPMGNEFIPLFAAWIAKIDPGRQLNQDLMIAQIKGEVDLAAKTNLVEYNVGMFKGQPAFFMNGYLSDAKGFFPGTKGMRKDYHLNMFIGPIFLPWLDLYLQAWHQALSYLFNRHNIGRVLVEMDKLNGIEKKAMMRLGFKPITHSRAHSSKYHLLVCPRADFSPFLHL
jgi:hypothetical protein